MKKKLFAFAFLFVFCALIFAACRGNAAITGTTAGESENEKSTVESNKTTMPNDRDTGTKSLLSPVDESALPLNDLETEYIFPKRETYRNYIDIYDTRGVIYQVGDPFVMRFDGKYYLYSSITGTHKGNDIYCWTSDNLIDWFCLGVCCSDPDGGTTYIAYAPEVTYYKGYFYLCEAPNGKGHYIFKSSSPAGPFERVSENLGKGIDGSFYIDDNGNMFLMSAVSSGGAYINYSLVNLAPLSAGQKITSLGSSTPLKNANLNGWTEGPGYFRRGNYFYLTYTGNHVRDASYRVGYAYTVGSTLFLNLTQPKDNITLMLTDTPYAGKGYNSNSSFVALPFYSGLGHSSNTIGPNLDSIYTAYHNEYTVSSAFNRRLNITQYFTNGSIINTNGYALAETLKPEMPDYSASGKESLSDSGNYYVSKEETLSVYTAELNFKIATGSVGSVVVGYKDEGNYTEISIENDRLTIKEFIGGKESVLAAASLGTGNKYDAVNTIRVVNGASGCEVYYNNMRKAVLSRPLSSGAVGYLKNMVISSTQFSNDAFGSSDFEAIKNLPSSFPAFCYLKGENRGWSIAEAEIQENGVRQGEPEATVSTNEHTAVKLKKGDWVKYAVNADKSGIYSFSGKINKACAGSVLEIITDSKTVYTMPLPTEIKGNGDYINIYIGAIRLESGNHTVKIRVKEGSFEAITLTFNSDAEALGSFEDALTKNITRILKVKSGSYTTSEKGVKTSAAGETLLTFGNTGAANYETEVDITLPSGNASGGIIIRAGNYDVREYSGSDYNFTGYYISLSGGKLTLYRYNWNVCDELASVIRDENKNRLIEPEATIHLKIVANQNNIKVYCNGFPAINAYDDSAFLSGYIGLYSKGASLTFKNLEYSEIH